MGACAAVLTSALPCSSSAEEVIVQSEQMAGRVPGVSVSLEMSEAVPGSPSPLLEAVLAGKKMDLERAQAIARDIAKPDYSLGQYYQDLLAAFPELHLFGLRGIGVSIEEAHAAGGRAAADEFQRTIGAFFAIYWLTRLDSDGKAGFCHGVDESWRPQEAFNEKSRAFFEDAEIWKYFQDLMVDAGLLEQGTKRVDPETTLALLVLTALHDIMKINLLLPSVQKSDAPYRGYSEAEVVADHDVAIFYIVERYTHLLPSLRRLQPSLQLLVQNVLSGLAFNNGWFVQAEAPPGAVFRGIKAAVSAQTESARKVGRRDLSLYFVHWLTDLAGGEPTPLFGCSKLCTLPMHVLKSFMQSVRYIQQLADRTETEVMEDYLKDRWANHQPSVGPMVSGPAGLAKARLLCMAQGNATEVLAAFEKLSDEDKEVLSVEMARTGAEQQSFSDSFVPSSVREQTAGPAFLVYYGPAFLQRMGTDSPLRRLEILAEIFRCARKLWPAVPDQAGNFVTVRIDAITIQGHWSADSELLLLRMCSNKQACIERRPKDGNSFNEDSTQILFNTDNGAPLCSQEEMIRRLGPAMLAEGHWYRKVAFAFLRPALPGEEIRTMVDGNEETKKIAQAGDYVVRADTKWKELYVLPQQKASDAYDLAAPMDIAERLDAAELRAGGFRCYRCRTRIKAIRASESLLSKICPQKRFMASWGSPCVVKADDMLAAQVSDSTIKEIYRIEKTVFKETFSLDQ